MKQGEIIYHKPDKVDGLINLVLLRLDPGEGDPTHWAVKDEETSTLWENTIKPLTPKQLAEWKRYTETKDSK